MNSLMKNPSKYKITAIILAVLALTFASAGATGRKPKATIQVVYQEQGNGDYRVYLFASDRALVCEEKAIRVVEQGDAVSPVVIECKH